MQQSKTASQEHKHIIKRGAIAPLFLVYKIFETFLIDELLIYMKVLSIKKGGGTMTRDSFEHSVNRNNKRLFSIALSYTKNHDDAEDILQNTFLKLWRNKTPFENDEHIDKWLTRVCINECKNYIKLPFRKNTSLEDAKRLYTFDSPKSFDIFSALMSLPKKEHTVIILFYYEDLSIKDISSLLKIKESTVKTRLHRARLKLKNVLGEDWINE